jgi:hypothetical protein
MVPHYYMSLISISSGEPNGVPLRTACCATGISLRCASGKNLGAPLLILFDVPLVVNLLCH